MSGKFDWQTEDDDVWNDLTAEEEAERSPTKRRRWPFLLMIALLLAGTSVAVLRQINQRRETNNEAMRTDIVSSHNILRVADEERDEELFISVLSGRNSDWTAAQTGLFKVGMLQDRRSLGLKLQEDQQDRPITEDDLINISFSPDMLEAEVSTELPYTIEIGSGLTETITLQKISVYRLGQERWLLAPPSGDFWGKRETLQGANLNISLPERDIELGNRLLMDLDRKLDEMCQNLDGIECEEDDRVEIQFSTDPGSLTATSRPQTAEKINDGLRITLPTPTLVGLPVDDAGYHALFRGYAAQMATALISRSVGYACCEQLPFYQALVDYQLHQISLKPWPVTADDYERIRDERLLLTDLADLWHSEDPDILLNEEGWRVYAVVDYLLKADPEISAAVLQRELLRRGSFFGWLNGSFSNDTSGTSTGLHSDLMRQFWLQAYPEATQAGNEVPVSTPKQDLQLICTTTNEGGVIGLVISKLYRYDIRQDTWEEGYSTPNYLFMNPLPDDEQLMLTEVVADDDSWQTGIWHNGSWQPIIGETGEYSVSFGQTDPAGTGLIAYVFPPDGRDADIVFVDIGNCNGENGCNRQTFPGIPVWSPDGSQVIFGDQPSLQLGVLQNDLRTILFDSSAPTYSLSFYQGERQTLFSNNNQPLSGDRPLEEIAELTYIGEGHAPFWLDENTVAYVGRRDGRFSRPAQKLVYTVAGEDAPQTLLTTDDLLEAYQDQASMERLFWIHYAMVHPTNPNLLFIAAFGAWDQQAHIFAYERNNDEARLLMTVGYTANHTLNISPDGRFLVLTGNDVDDPDRRRENVLLQVHDLNSGTTTPFLTIGTDFAPFPTYDWSADGHWLAMMLDHNLIGLYAPQEGALHLIQTKEGRCTSPSWINE